MVNIMENKESAYNLKLKAEYFDNEVKRLYY